MGEPSEAAGQAESFDVVVLGFESAKEPPQAGLKRMFGIDDAAANQLIDSAPVTVQRGVNRVRAEYFRRALERIGASVEIRDQDGMATAAPAPQSTPAPAARPMGSAAPPAQASPLPPAAVPLFAAPPGPPPAIHFAPVMDERAIARTERPPAPALVGAAAPSFDGFGHTPQARPVQDVVAETTPKEFPGVAFAGLPGAPTQLATAPVAVAPAAMATAFAASPAPLMAAAVPAAAPAGASDPFGLRAPAHPTVREATPAQSATSNEASAAAARYEAATAQTQRAPLSSFKIGETNAPFFVGMQPMAAQPAWAPPAAQPAPAWGAPAPQTAPAWTPPAAAPAPPWGGGPAAASPAPAWGAAPAAPAGAQAAAPAWGGLAAPAPSPAYVAAVAAAAPLAAPIGPAPGHDPLAAAMPSPAPAQPVLRAPQAATQLGASLDPSAKYGGIAWGQIDRGRYSTGPQAPAPQAGEALTPGAPLQLGPPPSAASPLALSPVPSPAPAQPVLDPGKPAVSSPAPAMATPGLTPMSAEVAARIPAAEPVRAPSANAMAAAMRKQALRDAESGLGDQRTSGRPQPNVPRRWENPAAAPSPAAAVVPAANGGGATAAALGGAGAGAEGEVSTPRALVSARYGRAEPGQVSPPRGITPSGEVRPVNLVDSAENATPPDVRALRKNKKLEDSRSFFETIPEALAFPLLGHGASWIISITLWTIALSLLRLIPGFNMVGVFVLLTTTLAFCADYHRRCVWSITTGAKSIDQPPDFDPQRIAQQYVASGSHLTFFMLLSQFPLAFWMVKQLTDDAVDLSVFQVVTAPMFWALAVGPAFYWPMAVATASMHSDYAAVWYVPMGLRAIVRAPLEHLTVVVLGALALIVVWAPFLWIGQASGLPSAFFFATLGLPFAISHGVMGALTGHMVRARDDAFA